MYILLLRSKPSRQHSKALYRWGVRRGKAGKYGKVRVKRKEMVGSDPGWNQGDRPPDAEGKPREPVTSKAGRTSETAAHSIAGHLTPQQLNADSPHPTYWIIYSSFLH